MSAEPHNGNTDLMHHKGSLQPIGTGILAAVVAFASTSPVVLAGLHSVGATAPQSGSGVLIMCLLCGFGSIFLSAKYRIPVTLAWSTPGAALLVTAEEGWRTAISAFLVAGALTVMAGAWSWLGKWVQAIPAPLAQAMLAGILFQLCVFPIAALKDVPWAAGPVVVAWVVLHLVAPKWATPGAFGLALVVMAVYVITGRGAMELAGLIPELSLSSPEWSWSASLSLGVPLFIVTMASQNIPGVAVMKSFGYDVPWRPSILYTGVATVAGAPAGNLSINLAAIGASLSAAPGAHADPARRWIAGVSTGCTFIMLGLFAGLFASLVAAGPAGLLAAVAGLALLGTFVSSLQSALSSSDTREAVAITLVTTASGVSFWSIGSAFWGLAAGLVVYVSKSIITRSPRQGSA